MRGLESIVSLIYPEYEGHPQIARHTVHCGHAVSQMHKWKGSMSYCDQFNYREMVLRERCTLTHTLSCA